MAKVRGIPYSKDVPCNFEIERVMLTTCFHDKVDGLLQRLDVEDFVDYLHRLIFQAFKEMVKRGIPLETQALHELLDTPEYTEKKRRCGIHETNSLNGAADLVLAEFINPANYEYYFRKLRSDRTRRWLLRTADKIKDRARDPLVDPLDTLHWAIQNSEKTIGLSKLEVEV